MARLAVRAHDEEQMDAPDLDAALYGRVLADLSRVNCWTLTARPTLRFLDRVAASLDSFSLLDVGFGHGDMLRAIARWARKRGIRTQLVGVDLNERSEAIARAATPASYGIDYRTGDYRDLAADFDFVVSSQVAHHMTGPQLRAFLIFMEETARRGWLISDLHRHPLSYAGFPLLARLIGAHPIVRQDGQLSIARSYRRDEWLPILKSAGIPSVGLHIARHFPFRLTVERIR